MAGRVFLRCWRTPGYLHHAGNQSHEQSSQNTKHYNLDTMNYHRAKSALVEICKYAGSGNEKEVKKILDEHPSLINEVIRSSIIFLDRDYNHHNLLLYDITGFDF